jgi:hypothetical protein
MKWLLLLVTVGLAWLTYDAFRWKGSIKGTPFSAIASLWGGARHLNVMEQNRLKERYASMSGVGELPWLFLIITVVIAAFTVSVFLQ